MRNRILMAAIALVLSHGAAAAEPLKTIASFSILGDLVKQVGGQRVTVDTLVGPNGDAHVFSPSPADAKKVAQARVVFENGLGLEGWMTKLVKSSGSKAPVVLASTGVKPREMEDEEAGHGHGDKRGNAHEASDPHAWQDVANVRTYVTNIRDGLIAADPDGRADYEAGAATYVAKLDTLDGEIRAAWSKIPIERRRIITSHDAFGYYAAAYGLEIVSPQGVSTEAEASAKDVARIIRQVKAAKIPAVFVENVSDRRLVERIAKETGARVGGSLYSDALSPADGPAATYLDMMRSNLRELTAALSS